MVVVVVVVSLLLLPDGGRRERTPEHCWVVSITHECCWVTSACSQNLREEVTQLTRLLRRAETETKVLQEALEGQVDPSCQLMATNWIQEKVFLSQEVTQS